jgi:hypothetical protein
VVISVIRDRIVAATGESSGCDLFNSEMYPAVCTIRLAPLLFRSDAVLAVATPYDFDQPVSVNALYAHPNRRFRFRSVRRLLS